MASASSTSAKNLFVDSKLRLAERVQVNVNNSGSICRQIVRGSRSSDLLTHSSRNFALQEHAIENTEDNLKRLNILVAHLGFQCEAISKSSQQLEEVREQLTLEFGGGSESLFGNIKERQIELDDSHTTLRDLIVWLRDKSGLLTQKPELFFAGDSVRPGILVLINGTDWELFGEHKYELQNGDNIVFLSTLHGG